MQRNWVIHRAANLSLGQIVLQGIAALNTNRVLVEDMLEAFAGNRRHEAGDTVELGCVFRCVRLPRALPIWKVAQLDAQNGGLDFVQAAVPPGLAAHVFCNLPVIAQRLYPRRKLRGICNQHARIAIGSKIFCGIKTDARRVSQRSSAPAFVTSADGLRVVFDYGKLMRSRKLEDWVHVRGETVEMDNNDCASPRRHPALELRGIDVVSAGANVSEHGLRAEGADGAARGHEREWRQEHFIARAHAARAQRQDYRISSRSKTYSVGDLAKFRNILFESGALATQYELLRSNNPFDSSANLSANRRELGGQIQSRDWLKNGGELRNCVHGLRELRRQIIRQRGGSPLAVRFRMQE